MAKVITAALLLALVLTLVAAREQPKAAPTDTQLNQLPDFSNKKVAARLKCSACKMVMGEIFEKFETLKDKISQPKQYHVIESLEDLCFKMRDEYGLLLRNNKPTEDFSKNKAITRMLGNWINSYLETRCGEIMDKFEDDFVDGFQKVSAGDLSDLQEQYCRGAYTKCSLTQLEKDEL